MELLPGQGDAAFGQQRIERNQQIQIQVSKAHANDFPIADPIIRNCHSSATQDYSSAS